MTTSSSSQSYPPVSPAFAVDGAADAIEFYKKAFGAQERYRLTDPETKKIGHAEITINGALIMLADEYPAFNKSPKTLGGTTMKICLMSQDVDQDFDRAVKAGAEIVQPLQDHFYGHRAGCLRDPFGHEWMISQEKEKVTPEEMQRRWNSMSQKSESKET